MSEQNLGYAVVGSDPKGGYAAEVMVNDDDTPYESIEEAKGHIAEQGGVAPGFSVKIVRLVEVEDVSVPEEADA